MPVSVLYFIECCDPGKSDALLQERNQEGRCNTREWARVGQEGGLGVLNNRH